MVQIQKTLKEEFGGGTKEFTVREVRKSLLIKRKNDSRPMVPFYYLSCIWLTFLSSYMVTHFMENLGWVDFDFACSTLCLVLPGKMVEHPKSKST